MTDAPISVKRDEMRCPTCGARQAWSDECRRCRCDLRLLREFADAADDLRQCAIAQLAGGQPHAARATAREYALLQPAAAAPLLAVCELACGDWREAVVAAQRATGCAARIG